MSAWPAHGKTVLVTGAASGIGARLVADLLARGASVLAADVDEAGLNALRDATDSHTAERLLCRTLDVRDPEQWQAAVAAVCDRWQRLDVLMNVAGVIRPGWVHAFPPEDVHAQLDINSKGVIFGTQAAARVMIEQAEGHIINIASLAGIAPVPGLSLYSASKFAVRGFSLGAAFELAEKGVKLTVVCPDAVQTPMLDVQVDREEAALTFSGSALPLTVEDVATAVFDKALAKAPMEVLLPEHRGWLAKTGNTLPGLSQALFQRLRARGRARQEAMRAPR